MVDREVDLSWDGPLCVLEYGEYKAGNVVIQFLLLRHPQSQCISAVAKYTKGKNST